MHRQERDVRDLTAPFFTLAENAADPGKLPFARFIWGKAWNVRGVVAAVSERLEHFSQGGVPQRSWMTMRFLARPRNAAFGCEAGVRRPRST